MLEYERERDDLKNEQLNIKESRVSGFKNKIVSLSQPLKTLTYSQIKERH